MKNSKLFLLILCLCFTSLFQCSTSSQKIVEDFDEHWKNLFFTESKHDEAKLFCERWTQNQDIELKIRAHACLASIAVYSLKDEGYAQALQHINDAMKIDPQNFMLHTLKINLDLFYDRDFTNTLNEALAALPNTDLDAWLTPLENWFQMQEYDAIKNYLLILDSHFQNQAKINSRIGMIYLFLDNVTEAERYLKKAADLDPQDISTLWSLGRIFEIKKQFDIAQNYYTKALEKLSPDDQAYTSLNCLFSKFLYENVSDKNKACLHSQNTCSEFFTQNCTEQK